MLNLIKLIAQGPFRALCILMALACVSTAQAQQLGVPQANVLTLSSDRLFSESQFGRRVMHEIESEGALLADENERIVAELSREEKDLTEKRAELPTEEFRPLAEAFDNKVQTHRESQRAKLDALARRSEEARQTFLVLVQPILIELLRESGASVVIERSNVFLSSDRTDVTDTAIARINEQIGDGSQLEDESRE